MTGMCTCDLCGREHPWPLGRTALPVLEAAWTRLGSDEAYAALAADVRSEVAAYGRWREAPEGPPALQVLGDRLRDHATEVPLPWELAGMCFGGPKDR